MKKRYILIILLGSILMSIFGLKIYKNTISLINHKTLENGLEDLNIEDKIEIDKIENQELKISNIKLLAVGDLMFHSPQFRAAYDNTKGVYDFTSTFKYIKKYVREADISLANFETVAAGQEFGFHGFPRFNTPKESLIGIKDAGFDIISTANNHSLDQGKKGLINTIDSIDEYGMKNIGTYKEPKSRILMEDIDEIKVAFLSYTYGMNGMESTLTLEELDYMINKIDEDKIKEDIEKSQEMEADIIVVFIHWGIEYHREPSDYQIELGRKMVDWGANIILGSHPHVIQKSEILNKYGKDNLIVYSMGNFLSNQRKELMDNKYTEDGIMIEIEIEKDFSKEKTIIKEIDYIPTWVHRYRKDGRLFYDILPIKDVLEGNIEIEEIDKIKTRLEESYNDTMSKIKEE